MNKFDLTQLIAFSGHSVESSIQQAITMLLEVSGFEEAFYTEINNEGNLITQIAKQSIRSDSRAPVVNAGDEYPWSVSACKQLMDRGVFFSQDMAEEFPHHEVSRELGIRSYLSIPIIVGGADKVVGTLCALSRQPDDLDEKQLQRAQILALLLTKVIEHHVLSQEIENRQQQLLHAMQQRTEEVAEAEHRIKTGIAAIIGWLEHGQADESASQKALDVALRRSHELHGHVTDMIEAAKDHLLEAVTPQSVKLDEVMAELVEMFSPRTIGREFQMIGDFDGWISADYFALRDCLEHLIDNALKHTVGKITLTHEVADAMHVISVRSDFTGHIPRLARVSDRLGEKSSGTGVGLSVVKSLAESMGGDVSAAHIGDQLVLATRWRQGREEVRLRPGGPESGDPEKS